MKVLMISEYYPPHGKGGGEISAKMLAELLSKEKNIEMHVLTSYFGEKKKKEKKGKLTIHRYLKTGESPTSLIGNIKREAQFKRSLLKELKVLNEKEKFDIIQCMNSTSIHAIKLKDFIDAKFILQAHGPVLFCPKATLIYKHEKSCDVECNLKNYTKCYFNSKAIGKMDFKPHLKYNPVVFYELRRRYNEYKKLFKQFDYYVAISGYMEKRAIFMGANKKDVKIIYHPIDVDKYLKLKSPKNKLKKILYLGAYSRTKGPQILLNALRTIKEPYEANFYGEGVLKELLRKRVKEFNLNVTIHDKISNGEVPNVLEKHDVVVVPSFVGEALGKVGIEARASGKLVVASDVGGIPDVVTNKKNGYLFKPGDANELGTILKQILKGKLSLSLKEIRKNIDIFSAKKIVPKIKKAYNSLIKS